MVKVFVCAHPELVGLHYKLGRNRLAAIEDATSRAISALAAFGLEGVKSECFGDWTEKGKFITQHARVHNYFAIEQEQLTDERLEAIREAATVFTSTMKSWEAQQ